MDENRKPGNVMMWIAILITFLSVSFFIWYLMEIYYSSVNKLPQ